MTAFFARPTQPFGADTAESVRAFFGTAPTPLAPLRGPAKEWGLAGVYVKDESKRLGLQAFKVFGASFAMAKYMSQRLGIDIREFDGLDALRRRYTSSFPEEPITFATCTDGNHGRAVSWAAKQLGQRAKVYMPKGSAKARVAHVEANGAECTVTDLNYDETVQMAFDKAKENGWVVLQDTAFEGYTEIPTWIMQGYTAMVSEAVEQICAVDGAEPTHVFLQVGVGSMAAAVLGYLVETSSGSCPKVLTLEPKNAACAFASAKRGDGEMVTVGGDLDTMIAGLACGVPSDLAWPILREHADGYFWMEDGLAGNGMRLLKKEGIEAGECGGAGVGLLQRLMTGSDEKSRAIRDGLGLGASSRVLLFNTEGATDPENYGLQMAMADAEPTPSDFDFAPSLKQRVLKRKAACGA